MRHLSVKRKIATLAISFQMRMCQFQQKLLHLHFLRNSFTKYLIHLQSVSSEYLYLDLVLKMVRLVHLRK